ncbi:MAG: Ig-like domain-containing protein [Ahrensia sp.]|nr:Ig-like domain-containing protein [Ahrensia sp.]
MAFLNWRDGKGQAKKVVPPEASPAIMRVLEPRILLDAAGFETATSQLNQVHSDQVSDQSLWRHSDGGAGAAQHAPSGMISDVDAFPSQTQSGLPEIAFIAPDVEDIETLLGTLPAHVETVLLEPGRDGVAQMSEVLSGRADLGAIHIVSHGSEGQLELGNAVLNASSMTGEHHAAMMTMARSLSADGDVLIYGCNFAGDASGRQAVELMAQLTGADVRASTDMTGHTTLGGDWTLEHGVGQVETTVFDAGGEWTSSLNTQTVTAHDVPLTQIAHSEQIGSDRRVGQSFSHDSGNETYAVDEVELALRQVILFSVEQDVIVSIRNSFDGPVLATGSISSEQLDDAYGWHAIELDDPITLNSNQTYVLSVETTDPLPSSVRVGVDQNSNYGGGTYLDDDGDAIALRDMLFRLNNSNAAPVITSNGGGDNAIIEVAENETFVTIVTAQHEDDGDDDDDDENEELTFSISGGSSADKFTIDAQTGELRFITPPDFENPTDAIGQNNSYGVQVRVTDEDGDHDTQSITVIVTDVDEAPTITSNGGGQTANIKVPENETYVTTVTAQDDDSDDNELIFSISGGASGDRFTIDAQTGELRFLDPPDFENPTDAGNQNNIYGVEVRATDESGASDTQLIFVEVTDVDEAPTITSNGGGDNARIEVQENQTFVTTVTAIAGDGDPGNLTYSILDGASADQFVIDPTTGELRFAVPPDFENPTDAVLQDNRYGVIVRVTNENGEHDTQRITVVVTNVDEAPVTRADTFTTLEDQTVAIDVLSNDADPESDVLRISHIDGTALVNGGDPVAVDHGEVALIGGQLFFTPNDNFNGEVTFQYAVVDPNGGQSSARVTVDVLPVNDQPVTSDNVYGLEEDESVSGNLIADDTGDGVDRDIDGDPLRIAQAYVGEFLTVQGGTIIIGADGSFIYQPATGFFGADSFEFAVTDGALNAFSRVSFTVAQTNDAPVALPDRLVINEDSGTVTGNVLTGEGGLGADFDPDQDSITLTAFSIEGMDEMFEPGATVEISGIGLLQITANGAFVFEPFGDVAGSVPQIAYTIEDGRGGIAVSTFDIEIAPVNDAPVASGGSLATISGQSIVVPADAFAFSDIEGDAASSITITALSLGGGELVHSDGTVLVRAGDTLTLAQLSSLVFAPGARESGAFFVEYTVNDADRGTEAGRLTIDVAASTIVREPEPEPEVEIEEEAEDGDEAVAPTQPVEPEQTAASVVATDQGDSASNTQGSQEQRVVFRPIGELAPAFVPEVEIAPTPIGLPLDVDDPNTLDAPSIEATVTDYRLLPINRVVLEDSLEQAKRDIEYDGGILATTTAKVTFAFGAALGVGSVSWLLQSGILAATLLSSLPAWRRFDPISIVTRDEEDETGTALSDIEMMRQQVESAGERARGNSLT